ISTRGLERELVRRRVTHHEPGLSSNVLDGDLLVGASFSRRTGATSDVDVGLNARAGHDVQFVFEEREIELHIGSSAQRNGGKVVEGRLARRDPPEDVGVTFTRWCRERAFARDARLEELDIETNASHDVLRGAPLVV